MIRELPSLPFSPQELDRYRLALRPRAPIGQTGPHTVRGRGRSLSYREHVHFTPGTDFRHIDWRASLRRRPRQVQDLLVRRFEAEEGLTLAISIDHRLSMALPEGAAKLQVACWTAQAVAVIAAADGDRVLLHRPFGTAAAPVAAGRGRSAAARVLHFIRETWQRPATADEPPELGSVARMLPPGAVWLLITDLYFDDAGSRLRAALARARRGSCWVILLELDSWPHERARLAEGAYRIQGPGAPTPCPEISFNDEQAERVTANIRQHREALVEPLKRRGVELLRWPWEARESIALEAFFRCRFMDEPAFKQLFRRNV